MQNIFRGRTEQPSRSATPNQLCCIFSSMQRRAEVFAVILLIFCVVAAPIAAPAYSVLSHEQIVDLTWEQQLKPLLLARFPDTTTEQMTQAHAYAYGGSVIQDMGYYPFGNRHFSDLVHYVRSGDFVAAMLADAEDVNEYAFALGALAHYVSDAQGHPYINRAVAIEYPKLKRRYGSAVTYEDDPKAHIRTEFGFDVAQVAKQRYAPKAYHDFIGFQVSKPLLERAFRETYGMDLKDVFKTLDLSIETFRRSISTIIPEMTKAALLTKNNVDVPEKDNAAKRKYIYYLSRADYEQEWGTQYERPGVFARVLAFLFKLVPKVGPFKAVAFQTPSTQTEDLYVKSLDNTIARYKERLNQMRAEADPRLPDINFDTGEPTKAGKYKLTDDSYAYLLGKLSDRHFDLLTADLRGNVLSYYGNLAGPLDTKRRKDEYARLQQRLQELKMAHTVGSEAIAGKSGN
jgi:zinc dependent phospholipase C